MYFRHFHIWRFPSFGSRSVLEPKRPTNQKRARKASHYDLLWFSVHEWILTRSMLPVVGNTLCCEVPPCFTFRMPRVVPDQRDKFENDELFRKLSRETEVMCISTVLAPGSFSTRVRVGSSRVAMSRCVWNIARLPATVGSRLTPVISRFRFDTRDTATDSPRSDTYASKRTAERGTPTS